MYIICIHNIQVVLGYCCIGSLNVVSKFKLVSIDVLASDYSGSFSEHCRNLVVAV